MQVIFLYTLKRVIHFKDQWTCSVRAGEWLKQLLHCWLLLNISHISSITGEWRQYLSSLSLSSEIRLVVIAIAYSCGDAVDRSINRSNQINQSRSVANQGFAGGGSPAACSQDKPMINNRPTCQLKFCLLSRTDCTRRLERENAVGILLYVVANRLRARVCPLKDGCPARAGPTSLDLIGQWNDTDPACGINRATTSENEWVSACSGKHLIGCVWTKR